MKKVLLLLIGGLSYAQVGINTQNPTATFEIVSTDNTSSTKSLKISNSTLAEMFTVQNDGNIGVNSPLSASNTAQFNVNSGAVTKSVLKLNNISNTKDRTVTSINYNQYSPLVIDNNGNVFQQYDIRTTSNAAVTFDGAYNAIASVTKLIDLNGGSIVQFQVSTDFVMGNNSVLYADITWSRNGGFRVAAFGNEANTGTNALTIVGVGTNTLTFDFATGADMVFKASLNGSTGAGNVIGQLEYQTQNSSSAVPFNIFYSFRSR